MTTIEPWLIPLLIFVVLVVVGLAFGVYFWIKVMPYIRELRETDEGRRVLIKTMFPPRFHK